MPPLPPRADDLNAPFDPSFGISPFAIEKKPQSLLPSQLASRSLSQSSSLPAPASAPSQPQPPRPPKHEYRSLTVNEALQYTPLTSISPFDTGESLSHCTGPCTNYSACFTLPTADFVPTQAVFESPSDKTKSQVFAKHLDKRLKEGDRGKEAQTALDTVKNLLQSTLKDSPQL
jgi:hypothetical protein